MHTNKNISERRTKNNEADHLIIQNIPVNKDKNGFLGKIETIQNSTVGKIY